MRDAGAGGQNHNRAGGAGLMVQLEQRVHYVRYADSVGRFDSFPHNHRKNKQKPAEKTGGCKPLNL